MSAVPLPERQKELKALAFRVVDILEGAGIPCCGLCGTALGAIRHGDMDRMAAFRRNKRTL